MKVLAGIYDKDFEGDRLVVQENGIKGHTWIIDMESIYIIYSEMIDGLGFPLDHQSFSKSCFDDENNDNDPYRLEVPWEFM